MTGTLGSAATDLAHERMASFAERVAAIRQRLHEVVVGQDDTLDLLLTCGLTGSHALLVGVPGLAKTLMVKALASAFEWKFARIQFTPDLMPSDITGYELLGRNTTSGEPSMVFRRGPVFANLVLADEIDRAAPKTQSALLEAMAERHVTVGGQTYPLAEPFLVVATQNPIEQEGTYPLPEAQLDRFMMEIRLDYPSPEQEEEIVLRTHARTPALPTAAFDQTTFLELRDLVWAVPVPQVVAAFAVRLCRSSRPDDRQAPTFVRDYVSWGAGPRGSQNLVAAAKARALLLGRTAPTTEDVAAVAVPVLRHRIVPNHRAVGDSVTAETLVQRLLRDALMETRVVSPYLDLAALSALEHLRFTTRHRIEGAYSGRHTSRVQGGAGEFVDYREYAEGEDLRRLDWKVLARSGRAYVRLFQDETNLICTLAVDTSGSMRFAGFGPNSPRAMRGRAAPSASKLQHVQRLASALAHVIARGQDQVGLALLGAELRASIAPGGTASHLNRVHAALADIDPQPGLRMAPALEQLFAETRRRGVLLLLSDFLMDDLEQVFAALRLFRHRRFEVLALHVVHPDEERLPVGTAFRFEGLENDGWVDCSPAEIRSQYAERFAAHGRVVRSLALAAGCDYHRVSTAIDYLQTLRGFLVERSG